MVSPECVSPQQSPPLTLVREHAANEVFVTGTFDDWKKTVQLQKEDGIFKKTVELPKEKVLYKFVVDGAWITNDSAPRESDESGNHNNVLSPDDIKDTVSTLSSAAPTSTTAALAGAVPKESEKSTLDDSIPGAFPLTPPAETPSKEPQAFSINPLPATEGLGNPVTLAPGEKVPEPSTLTSNTIDSTVKHDKEPETEPEEKVSVAPIPATAGPGNPIHLAPGEKVPDASTLTSNTVASTATTDAASYEKSGSNLPPQLGPVVTPEAERDANGGLFGASIASLTTQSAAPTSTTAQLAGAVPKEPKQVPAAVTDSQKQAGFTPEASANPEAVGEKKEVEQELKAKVPEEPPAAESTIAGKAAAVAAGATASAGAFAAATYAAKDKAAEAVGLNGQTVSSEVPEVVAESQKEAHVGPEAAANPEAVHEKKEVESELLKEVTKTNEAGEPAPTVTAATSETAPGLSEAALADSKPLKSSSESDALNAPASKPAVPETSRPANDSRDVSPMSKPTTHVDQPTVTTGTETTTVGTKTGPAETAPETPKKETTPESSKATPESVAADKKKKRRSIFGKIKEKFSSKS
ncbi:hypothetical protein CC80DRAFT_400399 [Byssothecium circinans]|uniref:AMP-activated protein kinase glycogen-binding domain-containing protein n=1 Tax=Byssothecium circinans TaxID=147558 RepID=A0A6A5UCF8_9PLEO|nr:hypothetical protein CC80DRAFT_400399 [Byssothecium circinans]